MRKMVSNRRLLPYIFGGALLVSFGCDEGLSAEDELGYKLSGDWHNVSNATLPRSVSFTGDQKYMYYNGAGDRVSWGEVRLKVLPGGQFRIEYVPTEGRTIRTDIGRFISDRALELTADSIGASPRTLAKRV